MTRNLQSKRAGHRAAARRGILASAAAFIFGAIFGYHEAGQRWSPDRSLIPGWNSDGDTRYDDPPHERVEVRRKARYFECNNGLVNRLADVFEQYTVGKGLPIIPKSSDPKWNAAAKRKFREWAKSPDLSSTQSFASFQSQTARRWFVDGEVFILKTKSDGVRPELRVQLLEAQCIATPPELAEREGDSICDGIEYDKRGRPIGYRRQGVNGEWIKATPEQIIHVCEPSRPGQRAFSFFDPVLNDLHDLDDLQKLEMLAAKDAAEKSTVITNEAGEITGETLRKQRFSFRTQDTLGAEKTETRIEQLRRVLGARTLALKTGEKMEQFRSDRPTVTTRDYWDYLTSKICAGVGISKLLVLPESIQGTVARADLDIQSTFFRVRSGVLAEAFLSVYLWVIDWEANFDRALASRPGDWREATIRPPRSCVVDVGRNSAAMLAELDQCARTFEMIYADLGEDWEEQFEQRAREEVKIDELAKQYGLSADRFRKSLSQSIQLQLEKEAALQQQQDDEQLQPAAA